MIAEIIQSGSCSRYGQILTLLNTSVQEPVRCPVSHGGPFCACPSKKRKLRNNNNLHRLDRRENLFYDSEGSWPLSRTVKGTGQQQILFGYGRFKTKAIADRVSLRSLVVYSLKQEVLQ